MPEIKVKKEVWEEFSDIAKSLGHDPVLLMDFVLKKFLKHLKRKIQEKET